MKHSRLGTALTTTKTYDDVYGTLTSIQTPGIQNNQYQFDPATGNLNFRTDVGRSLKESFEYNNLNSLTTVKVNDVLKQAMEYQPDGNIASNGKTNSTTGLGKYYYEVKQKHAVSSIDNTDNIVSTDPQNISYTSFNKVDLITEGTAGASNYRTLQYLYGPDQQRRRTVFNNGSLQKTTYFIGSYEKEIIGGTTRELHYIGGGDGLAAVYIKTNGTGTLFYILKDHLGSIQYMRSEDGLTTEESSFDAWGRRRNPANYSDFNVAASNYLNRGFTGHEHLNAFGLIDMNGRVYDPILGRFLSPDPYVQMPGFTQSFNRYSYCLNNPLIFTDPSGEFWNLLFVWGGNYVINWLDNTINKKMSPKQAFSQTPIMLSGNYSPSENKWSNYQVDAQRTANIPYRIGTDAFNEARSENTFFSDQTSAYNYMWRNALKNKTEYGGIISTEGVIVSKLDEDGGDMWLGNSYTYDKITRKYSVNFNNKNYDVIGHIHVHWHPDTNYWSYAGSPDSDIRTIRLTPNLYFYLMLSNGSLLYRMYDGTNWYAGQSTVNILLNG